MRENSCELFDDYARYGFHFPIRVFSEEPAKKYRSELESMESDYSADPLVPLAGSKRASKALNAIFAIMKKTVQASGVVCLKSNLI